MEEAKLLTECRNFDLFTRLRAHRGHIIALQMSVFSWYFSFLCRTLEQFLTKLRKDLIGKFSLNL